MNILKSRRNGVSGNCHRSYEKKTTKGLSKTKSSHYGILLEEKLIWRDEYGTDGGSQSVAGEDSKGSQRQRAPHVHGADSAGSGRRWEASGRTRGGMESRNHQPRYARSRSWDHLRGWLSVAWAQAQRRPSAKSAARYHRHCGWESRQADPQFRTTRLSIRLTATEVRRQLIAQQDYTDEGLPTAETIGAKLNLLGSYPKNVAKSQPQKNFPRPTPSLLK